MAAVTAPEPSPTRQAKDGPATHWHHGGVGRYLTGCCLRRAEQQRGNTEPWVLRVPYRGSGGELQPRCHAGLIRRSAPNHTRNGVKPRSAKIEYSRLAPGFSRARRRAPGAAAPSARCSRPTSRGRGWPTPLLLVQSAGDRDVRRMQAKTAPPSSSCRAVVYAMVRHPAPTTSVADRAPAASRVKRCLEAPKRRG